MLWRRASGWKRGLRQAFLACLVLSGALLTTLPAQATLLPEGFFDRVPEPGDGKAAISADYLSQDANGIVTANGQVDMTYRGYYITADRLEFNQRTEDVTLIGHVVIRDPYGTEYAADRVEITGHFKKAILNSMVLVTSDGAMITSTKTDHDEDRSDILEKGTYSPCGTCIDAKGRRIGWRVRTERMIYDRNNELLDLHQPVLEVLGYPVAWLPWIRLPDPSNPRANGIRMPGYAYGDKIGLKVETPYFYAAGKDTDILFSPALVSRQGLLMHTSVVQRFGKTGEARVAVSGVHQGDQGAFTGEAGDREWRGAIQTSTRFTPTKEWTFGTSYSLLSDPAYLPDYFVPTGPSSVNEVYAEYLTPRTFGEARVQEFRVLGNVTQADQDKQAATLPTARFEHAEPLGSDAGEIRVSARLLNARRSSDSTASVNGVSYVPGYAETKTHGTLEAGWSKQWVTPGGVLLTPYTALRGDFARYDGASAMLPGASELYNVTPIAALDMRYPLVAVDGGTTHIVEPIAQMAYRASDTTKTGITNDNAQSFVFDDTNLFSFNRFSGTDRQETGLRANIGGHYLADFEDGSYLDFIAGQSFHLAGTNALGIGDAARTGTSSGLGGTGSYIVAGVKGAVNEHFSFGAKAQIDPASVRVVRTAVAGSLSLGGWALSADYAYAAADAALGAITEQQDIGGSVRIPVHEYWYADIGAGWDITAARLLDHSAGLTYDDGYFSITGSYAATGANPFEPAGRSWKLTFRLKGPDGAGYSF